MHLLLLLLYYIFFLALHIQEIHSLSPRNFKDFKMGNFVDDEEFSIKNLFKKSRQQQKDLPIETTFKLPSPLPSWPPASIPAGARGKGAPRGASKRRRFGSKRHRFDAPLGAPFTFAPAGIQIRVLMLFKGIVDPFDHEKYIVELGGGFASGIIDLGGLQISQISTFNKIWSTQEGGPNNLGATFYEPTSIPNEFFMLGSYSQPNNKPFFGNSLVAKDGSNESILKTPIDYTLVWSSQSTKIKQENVGYIWLPTPPQGYKSIGYVVTNSPEKPPLEKVRCVRADFTDVSESSAWIWGIGNGISVYDSRPRDRGIRYQGVSTNTFIAVTNGNDTSGGVACLKNVEENLSAMPNLPQVKALIQEYSPLVYFHPNEEFLPSSVEWFFENGALIYTKGQESNPMNVNPDGSNLPQNGSNDGAFWLDLPSNNTSRERIKKGDLQDAVVYYHVKPMLGGSFTDLAMWVFYPFNGAARAKVEFLNIALGKIGEHVGDWEHVTLRISNFNGELKSVYFSQHNKGTWVDASEIEFQNDKNTPVVYSSLHGHAAYDKAGDFLQGNNNIGIRNDTEKSNMFLNAGGNYSIVCGEYLGSTIVEPFWLNYAREWGPKIDYNIDDEIKKVQRFLPGKLKSAFNKAIRDVPPEVLGEEGPTGPKWKDNWYGDERD